MTMLKLKFSNRLWAVAITALVLLAGSRSWSSAPQNETISMDFQNADIKTVLRSFSVYAGKNIIAGPDVKGPVNVHLENVPWREALDLVLKANGYAAQEEDDVIRVAPWDQFVNEDIKMQEALRKREDLRPLVTQVVDISFAKADELAKPLTPLLSKRGVIQVDDRTNSIIVSDIDEKVKAVADMAKSLDSETPQVEIVAKLVDVDARLTRDLGVKWTASKVKLPGVQGEHSFKLDATGTADDAAGTTTGSTVQEQATLNIGTISGPAGNFEATISALERDNKANIISNPRITTLNNREATIIVGKKIPLIVRDEAGNPITQVTTIGIQMRVTPHVNSKTGEITMDLHPEVSDLSAQATVQGGIIIVTAEADTRVMVQNGSTAVIGGLIRTNESFYRTGVPILRNLPLFGSLFGSKSKVNENRELLIFVTPRIVE
ncbi:MAG TPA: type IV pilus secretin PilQ [bacterium]|nr:type IV pilus secretin PilQ [bacterium]